MATSLESVQWIHGAADCERSTDPLIQIHALDADTFILRLSKCFSFEGNFIYLMFGSARAIVFDTGGPPGQQSHGEIMPIRQTIDSIVSGWLDGRGMAAIELIVAHTHGHGDHVFWDRQFDGRPRTTIVQPVLGTVKAFYGLPNWPEGEALVELGGRALTVFPIPGHEETHIAVYDARAGILLTGDTLYPGLLTVQDWTAYRRSAARLARFAERHDIRFVLGNHIEMKNTPRQLYPIGTTFQPDEHPLALTAGHVREFHLACEAMAASPHRDIHDDFIIDPGGR
jgi:hydroxyacylglutathione hydrolase